MINIREAQQEDVQILNDLIMALASHHNQREFVETSESEMLKSGFRDRPKFGALIAEFDGSTAGFLSFTWNYSIWGGRDYMNIDDVFVWEQYRGKRIGEKLMLKAKAVCLDKGVDLIRWEVESENVRAIAFYKKLGARMQSKGIFRWKL